MKKIMNITTSIHDLPRYRDNADLKGFYRGLGLDGLEVMEAGEDAGGIISPEDTVGVHLKYFNSWMDLWTGNESRLLAEYGSRETCEGIYGGFNRESMIEAFRKNLDFAASMKPEYLVFHISECTLAESMTRDFYYTDEQVTDAAAELVNEISGSIRGKPLLLFENLWYPGLTMLRPEITERLLSKVRYPHTGVMLDVGHLLHNNTQLVSLEQAVDYIMSILDRYPDTSFIKGIHLHQTLNGKFAEEQMRSWKPADGSYPERFWDVAERIFQIDSHKPFLIDRIQEVISRLSPQFLVLEQLSGSREEHEINLRRQLNVVGGRGEGE